MINLSRAEASSRWCGVIVRRSGASSGVVHVIWPWFKITWSVVKSPRVAEQCDVNIRSINQSSEHCSKKTKTNTEKKRMKEYREISSFIYLFYSGSICEPLVIWHT
ncbi:uncharacterized protein TNCV_3541561 [Trichonephila clavipes]|nr:uncharacterized protein TNCV_3541561 [Trichonephila clavipes]